MLSLTLSGVQHLIFKLSNTLQLMKHVSKQSLKIAQSHSHKVQLKHVQHISCEPRQACNYVQSTQRHLEVKCSIPSSQIHQTCGCNILPQ